MTEEQNLTDTEESTPEETSETDLATLQAKLKACEAERQEYLDGWQRMKADATNAKRTHTEALTQAHTRAKNEFVQALLPALDSFDIALKGEAWERVDEVWRTGVTYVHAQLIESLNTIGVTSYGETGDVFDPMLHEALSHESGGKSHTIARVERKGYKHTTDNMVIRPAHVVVFE